MNDNTSDGYFPFFSYFQGSVTQLIERYETALNKAIEEEDYEYAAFIRDAITELKDDSDILKATFDFSSKTETNKDEWKIIF